MISPAARTEGFHFEPFSRRQKQVLTWWAEGSPYRDWNGVIADGSIRSGKTLTMSLSFVIWAMETFREMNFAFCGNTVGSLRRNVTNNLPYVLKGRGYEVLERRGDNLLIISRGDRVNYFYLFGGRDEASYKLIQGITLAGIMFDEVALQPESFVSQATGRCSVPGSKWWFNCNPAERLHWFKTRWINRWRQQKLLYIHFTMADNLSLQPEIKARYESAYTGVFYQRYIQGLWVAAEGVIYDCWDEAENSFDLSAGPPPFDKLLCRHYVACDYGTTNPTVFLDAWYDGRTFWITREYYQDSRAERQQLTPAQHGDAMDVFLQKDHSPIIIVDPAAEAFRLELRNRGYRVTAADNEVLEGIRFMSTMIAKRRLMVDKSCRNFRSEIESYIWDAKAAQHGEERPVKERDHAMDACRYLCKTVLNRAALARA